MRVLNFVAYGLVAIVLLYVLSVGPVLALVAIRSNFHPSIIRDATEDNYKPLVIACAYVPGLQVVMHEYYRWSVRTLQPFAHPKSGPFSPPTPE